MTRDNVTGLVWEMKTDDNSIHKKDKTFTYCDKNSATNGGNEGDCGTGTGNAATDTEAFIKALNDTNYGGFSDWRLPTVSQLSYLINSSIPLPGPAIATDWFPNTIYWPGYWSFAAFGYPTLLAWRVSFAYGNVYDDYRTSTYFARAVRGQSALAALTDNGDATVTDTANGLVWQKATAPGTYTWQGALSYCENLNLANHTDWRLPNRNELQSLVVYSRWNPPVDPLLVATTRTLKYWSSTTYASDTSWAWYVNFYFPQIYAISKTDSHCVRCVRGLSGTIEIDPEPDSINAPWTLTGVGGFSRSGAGNQTLRNMTPGNYTLTWGNVTGWAKPKPTISTQNLTAGETITFAGTYKKTKGLFWFHLLLGD